VFACCDDGSRSCITRLASIISRPHQLILFLTFQYPQTFPYFSSSFLYIYTHIMSTNPHQLPFLYRYRFLQTITTQVVCRGLRLNICRSVVRVLLNRPIFSAAASEHRLLYGGDCEFDNPSILIPLVLINQNNFGRYDREDISTQTLWLCIMMFIHCSTSGHFH